MFLLKGAFFRGVKTMIMHLLLETGEFYGHLTRQHDMLFGQVRLMNSMSKYVLIP